MRRETVPAYNEDGVWTARIFWALAAVILAIILFDPFGLDAPEPQKNIVPEAAHCTVSPERYGGRVFCAEETEGGDYGYVNPGSMEWEVE